MKTFLTALLLFLALCVGEAQAGRNVWTTRIYGGSPKDGCVVKCSGSSCVHGCSRRNVTINGIRYQVQARVVPGKKYGLGVKVTVKARVEDGRTHGFDNSITLEGRVFYLPPYGPGEVLMLYGFGFRGWSHTPTLGPGRTVTIQNSYGSHHGIEKGHRLVLPVRMYFVKPPGWPKSTKPLLGTVVLTVPYRGKPRIRIR